MASVGLLLYLPFQQSRSVVYMHMFVLTPLQHWFACFHEEFVNDYMLYHFHHVSTQNVVMREET